MKNKIHQALSHPPTPIIPAAASSLHALPMTSTKPPLREARGTTGPGRLSFPGDTDFPPVN